MSVLKNSISSIKWGVALHYTPGWDNKGAMLISVIPSPHGTFPSSSWPVFQTETSCQTVPKKENSLLFQHPLLLWTVQCRVWPQRALHAWQAGLRGLHIFLSENWIPLPLYSVCDSLGAASVTHCQTTPNEYNRDQKHLFSTFCHGVSNLPVNRSYFWLFVGT